MNILITGGSGFIGRNLVEYFSKEHTIFVPTHKELEFLNEYAVKQFFDKHKIDIVIHAASAPAHRKVKEPRDIAYRNLRIFFNISRCNRYFSKMIFLGSGAEYGIQRDVACAKESDFDEIVPQDEHGFSKYVCSKYIENSKNIINLRLFGVFGKYEDYQMRFISNAICKAVYNLPITINQNRVFSYLYIDDLARVIEYFIKHKAREKFYNVVPGEKTELAVLAKKVVEVSGRKLEITVKNPGMGREYTADNSRLLRENRGIKFTPMNEAITELYKWYENRKPEIDYKLLLVDP